MMDALYRFARPFLLRMDAERAHVLTVAGLSFLPLRGQTPDDPRLSIPALGLTFPNPIGLAAGFDKNADVPDAMLRFGFGFAEAGTVTPLPQAGNPKPRLFRLAEDRGVINRLGFNNEGLAAAKTRLSARRGRPCIVGINIGANKDSADRIADYALGMAKLGGLASYATVNVSSPNTPGLRGLQNRDELERLLDAVMGARAAHGITAPILLKIAPDLDEDAISAIVETAVSRRLDGLIVSNTTISRPETLHSPHRAEMGGLSGAPLMTLSTDVLRRVAWEARGRLCLVGVGGVSSGADAYAKIKAGATLVQLYSALAYEGPGLVMRIKRELLRLVVDDGYPDLAAAMAAHHKSFAG
jgi:dihydroorotate dehydrogenase